MTKTSCGHAGASNPEPELRVVELRGIPLGLAGRAADHHATLMRELALVDAAEDATAHRRLAALSDELRAKYARFADPQRARAAAATAAGEETIDLRYEVPPELADDVDELRILLDEVDSFCRDGELVTLATPSELVAYRTWFLGEFCTQLREGAAPMPWAVLPTSGSEGATAVGPRHGTIITIDDELDLEGAAIMRDEFAACLESGVTHLTVDLAGCAFVDSVGISLLLTTLARLRDSGGSLVLVNVNDAVRRTLHHAGIVDLLVRE